MPASAALPLLLKLAEEPAVADDACPVIVEKAGKNAAGLTREARQSALKTVLEKSTSDTTKKKAQEALDKLS